MWPSFLESSLSKGGAEAPSALCAGVDSAAVRVHVPDAVGTAIADVEATPDFPADMTAEAAVALSLTHGTLLSGLPKCVLLEPSTGRIFRYRLSPFRAKMALTMVITHHGGQCFKVTFGDLTLVFDPISKKGTLPAVRFGSDVALVSRNHPDMNGVEEVSFAGKEPFIINGPGEYEHSGVTVQGFLTKSEYGLPKGTESAVNTVYAVSLEGMTLVHLGALSDPMLSQEAREAIDEIDVLFLPIGGDGVLDAAKAAKLAVTLEPRIIIPMHWSGMGEPKALDHYLKEEGNESEKVDKLTLKKKDAAEKDGAIIVITS